LSSKNIAIVTGCTLGVEPEYVTVEPFGAVYVADEENEG
jgi:hypothetical protein